MTTFRLGLDAVLWLVICAVAGKAYKFTSPTANGHPEPSFNSVYSNNSILNIAWDPAVQSVTDLAISQILNGDTLTFDYVAAGLPANTSNYSWNITTTCNLTVSPMFYLAIIIQGAEYTLFLSETFNISRSQSTFETPESTSTSSDSSLATLVPSSTTSTVSQISTSLAATSSAPVLPDKDLSAGAIAGISIGAAAVGIFALTAGWILLKRHKRRPIPVNTHSMYQEAPTYTDAPHEPKPQPIYQLHHEPAQQANVHEMSSQGY